MGLSLSAEQEAIRDTARKLARERAPVAHLRMLRDTRDAVGFSRELWREMASLGLVGIALPEDHGGAGLGFVELGLVLAELGRCLSPTPFVSTVLLGAGAIARGGTATQRREWLPAIAAGERLVALALDEGTRHAPEHVATIAERLEGGFVISGEKGFVLDGHVADALVVAARTAGGLTLFLIPAAAPGLTVARTTMIDSRNAARVRLDRVVAPRDAVLGEVDGGAAVLGPVLDRAVIGLAAEMLGGMVEVFERTVEYLKVRKQFGVPIGSFQALQHRAAQMFCEIELTRSLVVEALAAVDEDRGDVPLLASAVKARCGEGFCQVAGEAIQMHGGVGVTDELDIGFFFKRARVCEMTLGSAAYHRDRFARLSGY